MCEAEEALAAHEPELEKLASKGLACSAVDKQISEIIMAAGDWQRFLMNNKNKLKTNSNTLRQYKQTITLSQIQREILVGTLLGDASIPLYIGRPLLCVRFVQTIARENYIWHLYDIFNNPVGRLCRRTPARAKPA